MATAKKAAPKKTAPKKAAPKKATRKSIPFEPSLLDLKIPEPTLEEMEEYKRMDEERETKRVERVKNEMRQLTTELMPEITGHMLGIEYERAYLNFAGKAMAAMLPHHSQVTPDILQTIANNAWLMAGLMMASKPQEEEPAQ